MAREKSISIYTSHSDASAGDDPWRYRWPNDADLTFNYNHLLEMTAPQGVASNRQKEKKIAIVGGGAAGLAAARELFRCGYQNIDIYEASERIGGRLWSIPMEGQHTVMEMGAMRMPFFSKPGSHNSLLDHYCREYGIRSQDFPNPGSLHARTGIFINDGFALSGKYQTPQMEMWEKLDQFPPNEELAAVYEKWSYFADLIQTNTKEIYQDPLLWKKMWQSIVKRYWNVSFVDLVFTPSFKNYNPEVPGDFGGLGMTREEANIFYTIGAGDGGWGAFFHISSLFVIRTLLFGYATNHQLIQGRFDFETGEYIGGPHDTDDIRDSKGQKLSNPCWMGVQSVAEGMFYYPMSNPFKDEKMSLYEAMQSSDFDINLYTQSPVKKIKKMPHGVKISSDVGTFDYDAAVLTCPTWAIQLNIELEGFDNAMIPTSVKKSLAQSHWITSCKVFFPLKERYWEVSNIPQLIMTDRFIQGVYGYAINTEAYKNEPGFLLASYTWEDDALKLMSIQSEEELSKVCLRELDEICLASENVKQKISPFVDTSKPVVIHWSKQPTYAGCAKLYRARTWEENASLMYYNQNFSKNSALYFAGDSFSVTSGWVEPALRSAIDATIYICKNLGADFHPEFDMEKRYFIEDSLWSPEEYSGSLRTVTRFPAGEVICHEGEKSSQMFILVSGTISIFKKNQKIAEISEINTFVGYMSFFSEKTRNATMVASTDCDLIVIEDKKIEATLKASPELAIQMVKDLLKLRE